MTFSLFHGAFFRRCTAILLLLAGFTTTAYAEAIPSFAANGQVTLCTNPTIPPMSFVNGADTSQIAGFDLDLAHDLANAWRAKLIVISMDFDGLFPSLSAGRCDIVISGVMKQAGREKHYDAVGYFDSSVVIIGRIGAPSLQSLDDLSGRTIALQAGTSYGALVETVNQRLRAHNRPLILTQQYPGEDEVVQQLLLGRVDNIISQDVELYYRQKQLGGKVAILAKIPNDNYKEFAAYIQPNEANKAALSQTINALRQSGELTKLAEKWEISASQAHHFSQKPTPSGFNFDIFFSALFSKAFLKGAALTLLAALLSHFTAILLSIPIALKLNGPRSPLRSLLSAYVAIFRGAPTLLQLLFIWNALPQFFPIFRESWFTPFLATWLSLSINESAYQVEINRSALRAVDDGQLRAADALGMSRKHIYRYVIFPQALRIALPPTINEFISLLKTTSLASVISLQELLSITQIQVARSFDFTEYYSAALIYYLAMVFFFLFLQQRIERRFIWADRNQATSHG